MFKAVALGTLLGEAKSDAAARSSAHAGDLEAMRRELREKLHDAAYQEAFKLAAAEVHGEIIEELRLESAGKLRQRRLSDPKNVEGRNKVFAEAAAVAVSRVSGGQVSMTRASVDRVRLQRVLK